MISTNGLIHFALKLVTLWCSDFAEVSVKISYSSFHVLLLICKQPLWAG